MYVRRSRSKHKVLKEIEAQFPENRNKKEKKESIMADKLRGCGGRRIAFRFPCIDLLLDLVFTDAKKEREGKRMKVQNSFFQR